MKETLISTVLNEEKNIEYFINSIINQTKKPKEFIIVDGGSEDKTFDILKKIAKKNKWIKLYQIRGLNISEGRNYAIKKAKGEIIITCDAGGKFKKDWLEKMLRGFNGEVGFGVNKPLIKNDFHKALAKVILHKNVCGSSRNMIFLKKAWNSVGGYPEDLLIGEDTLYDERLRSEGWKFQTIEEAICLWEMREDIGAVKKQFYRYGYWDGVSFRKYKMLPVKHMFAAILPIFLIPIYPILYICSRFNLVMKIRLVKRFGYVRGFWKGYFRIKEF
jgi:glycosyltransferase involved in cell wall biosynthesis